MKKKKINVIITIIVEYNSLCINMPKETGSEYASGPKYAKILNMAKFLIWQGSQYSSVKHRSEFAIICLDRFLGL